MRERVYMDLIAECDNLTIIEPIFLFFYKTKNSKNGAIAFLSILKMAKNNRVYMDNFFSDITTS
jgi:hypothetical protein